MKKYDDEIQRLLKTVYEDCAKEDYAVRERQLRLCRRLKLLWEGFQRVWYSEVAHDWRIYDENADNDTEQGAYDKPINVFKAYLESIIAALSVTVPPIKCFPDDADNTLDLATAKAGDKIAQLVYRHNNVSLLWLHGLFIHATEGLTACYAYPVADKKYGTYENKKYRDDEEAHNITSCSSCGAVLDDQLAGPPNPDEMQQPPNPDMTGGMPAPNPQVPPTPQQIPKPSGDDAIELEGMLDDEFMPDNDDAELHAAMETGTDLCPVCMAQMSPQIKTEKFIVTRLVGITKEPKTRICMEVYGGLNVKVAVFAKNQKGTPYLIFNEEIDSSLACEKYEDYVPGRDRKGFLAKISSPTNAGSYTNYEQFARLSPQYQGEFPSNVVTVSKAWIRAGKFNILPEDDAKKLKKLFPDGVKVTFVNDIYACAENESLDDSWTLNENPLSDYLYFNPMGEGLVSIQEITNDLISLVLQTIEHGIGQTFADPAVLDFNAYSQTEAIPGGIFPAKPKSGKSISEAFHEMKTATLSAEVMPFMQNIQSLAQLESGALPSLFGGAIEGSETASQYSMSRAQALQRLQNTWKMFTIWWKEIFGKVVPMYIKEMKDDERDVQRDDDGNFVNVLIRKAELEGSLGKVELEANENLPITWAQKKDIIEKLLLNPNPKIMEILSAPENITLLHDSLGLVDFYVPGEDDIIKQYDEIKMLLNSEPIANPMDPTGQMPELPSVEIDPIFDNNQVEFEICRKWIISEAGRQTKVDNEAGYRNVLLHGKLHYMQVQQQQMQMAMAQGGGAAPNAKPNPHNQEAPITGEGNVSTIQ